MSYWIAGSAIASLAYSVYSGERAASAQKKAQAEAKQNALAQEKSADEAMNAQNMKLPDTGSMMSAALLSGKAGQSGTMLTGAKGIDKNKLELQRNTLLGG